MAFEQVALVAAKLVSHVIMVHAITLWLDAETERQVSELAADKPSRSAAVVEAIHLAYWQLREKRLRAESEALANDPDDRAEIRAIRAEMDRIGTIYDNP